MKPIRLLWLALCIAGILLPMRQFIPWLSANGWDFGAMVAAWQANGAVAGLFWDLAVAAAAFTIWVLYETWTTRRWSNLAAIPATYLVGLSFGLPLYLFLRSR